MRTRNSTHSLKKTSNSLGGAMVDGVAKLLRLKRVGWLLDAVYHFIFAAAGYRRIWSELLDQVKRRRNGIGDDRVED